MNWIEQIVVLLSSNVVIFFIGLYAKIRKNRKQPIIKRLTLNSFFVPENILDTHKTNITISGIGPSEQVFHYRNLYLVTLDLENIGNIDFEKFEFSFTARNYTKIIKQEDETLGSDHTVNSNKKVSFENPVENIRIALEPFNRQDVYKIKFYITNEEQEITSGDLEIDTKIPIKFVNVGEPLTFKTYIKQPLTIVALMTSMFTIGYFISSIQNMYFMEEMNERLDYFNKELKLQSDTLKNIIDDVELRTDEVKTK